MDAPSCESGASWIGTRHIANIINAETSGGLNWAYRPVGRHAVRAGVGQRDESREILHPVLASPCQDPLPHLQCGLTQEPEAPNILRHTLHPAASAHDMPRPGTSRSVQL